MPDFNYWAMLACVVASMIIGSLWFGPLFGKIWMEGMGWDTSPEGMKKMMEKGKKQMPALYGQQALLSLIMAFVFAHVLAAFRIIPEMANVSDISQALQGAFWMWLGFIVPVKYGASLWEGKKCKYVLVDLGYWLVLLVVIGLILSLWR